jgi:dihydropyrimidinase
LPSLELRLPVLYTEGVAGGRIRMSKLVDLLSMSLAKVWGLYPQKGTLSIGADADIVVFDPAAKWTVDPKKLHMAVDWSPYSGRELQGRIDAVISRGDIIIESGEFRGSRGRGRFIQRKLG